MSNTQPSSPSPASTADATLGDQVVVLRDISWAQFEALAKREGSGVRMAYLDGILEIMSPSRPRETWKKLLARLLEAYAEERGLTMAGFGSETYRKRAEQAGVEADESYCLDTEKRFPDLAIEVVVSHGGVNRLEIYRRLRVREVWFGSRKGLQVFKLGGRRYTPQARSDLFPELDLDAIWRIVTTTPPLLQTQTVRAFRKSLHERPRRRR